MKSILVPLFTVITIFSIICSFSVTNNNIRAQDDGLVYLIKIDGSINPSTSEFIHKSLGEAVKHNARCLIIELNTPGGLLKSTRYIVSDLLTSEIPVVVYVYPSGAQSAWC